MWEWERQYGNGEGLEIVPRWVSCVNAFSTVLAHYRRNDGHSSRSVNAVLFLHWLDKLVLWVGCFCQVKLIVSQDLLFVANCFVAFNLLFCSTSSSQTETRKASWSATGVETEASARPPHLTWPSCELDLWPSDPQSWPFHALAPWTTTINQSELVGDVAVPVSVRQAFLFWAVRSPDARPRLNWRRSSSTVLMSWTTWTPPPVPWGRRYAGL